MAKQNTKPVKETDAIFIAAKNKSYFSLDKKSEKKIIDQFISNGEIKNFTYVINPAFLKKIQPNLETYILFVDTRRADYYQKIKEYIITRKKQLTSYLTTGDMDFIIYYTSTEIIHKNIKDEIIALLNEAPKEEGGDDELVLAYKIKKFLKLKGKKCSGFYNGNEDLSLEEKINISNTLYDYRSEKVINKFGTEKKVENFLDKLEKENILEKYYLIETISANKFKAVALIQYTVPGYYEKVILQNKEINKFIVDCHEVQNDNIKDGFYRRADFLLLAEFQNCEEYHKWKEAIYNISLQNKALINIMTFVVEHTLSEIPQSIGDLREFEELCKKYNGTGSKNIFVGHPYYYDSIETDRTINIKTDSLKDQGMIIGYQGSGKTYTTVLFAKRLIESNIRVHFIDKDGGISKIINDEFQELKTENKVIEHDCKDVKILELYKENGVHVYNIVKENYLEFISKLFDLISIREESTGRKTTDVIIFEEAHEFLSYDPIVDKLFHLIKHAGRKGISLWFSTQNFSQFPVNDKGIHLANDLKNRIIQKIEPSEASSIAEFLFEYENVPNISMVYEELKNLERGQAIVSFYHGSQLNPIKIAISETD
jgi:hypothetical protein